MTGSIYCHSKADCFDTTEGFCCKCQPKYYGNGRNCFMDGIPLRVNGKVNISVNNISVQNLDLQAYVVTTDGRSYTAVSQMPQVLGPSMQLVESLGGVIAWLFARPINDAKNGFQLTGGILNHTVSLQFDTNHRILVKQRYLGLDVYDQLKMESEVTGTLPFLEQGTVLKMPDFQAWFSKISSGVFRSQSEHVVQIENSTVTFLFQKDETIEFNEYCSDANQDFVNLRLKSARNFILFDTKEGILRFSSTNKVSKSSGIEDPCIEGHAKCVANSSCIAQEDTFKCVCNPG
ncbi:hypothetical protein AAG570_014151 [Ranatra chinensis]|uniref:Nidogen G2 beta-barrel domain-containing protein n=1 Tax=Ranatra chinensis TaxID=642074 RepID=A0ABD0XTC1_9HEMI